MLIKLGCCLMAHILHGTFQTNSTVLPSLTLLMDEVHVVFNRWGCKYYILASPCSLAFVRLCLPRPALDVGDCAVVQDIQQHSFGYSDLPSQLVNPLPTNDTSICVMSSHKPIRIYMGGLILGVNTLYRLFCFLKLFPMVGKRLTHAKIDTTVYYVL